MKIIVDTREQQPLWSGENIIRRKLDEGDYATTTTEPHIAIERKNPGDLYGSILKGHERFKREILRAKQKNKEFHIFVECNKEYFISMRWKPRGIKLFGKPKMLAAIINTMETKHDIKFHWCEDREDMRNKINEIFIYYQNKEKQ
jgi:ERCC4-type nuclease